MSGGFGGWGALIQRGQQWADRGVDWAIYKMKRDDYASQVRHLRRREYQDMMFSMKAAGLNPILASGAQPGHSAAFSGMGAAGPQAQLIDVANNAESPGRIGQMKAKEMEGLAKGRLADQQSGLALDQRDLTKATTAFQIATIDKIRDERELLRAQRIAALANAGALDASAKDSLARARNASLDAAEKEATQSVYDSPLGTGLKALEKAAGAILPWAPKK